MVLELSNYVVILTASINGNLQVCEEEKINLQYTIHHRPHLNSFIEIRFSVIKEGALDLFLNAKLSDIAQKILWAEEVHTYKRVQNSMATTGSTKSLFENIYGEEPNIIGLF